MARGMNVFRRTGTTVPRIQRVVYTAGATFKKFALVVVNGAGTLDECTAGAGAATIFGLALQGAGTGPGNDLANASVTNATVQGLVAACSVAVADGEQEYSARGVNGGTDPVVPLQTHISEQYGVSKVGNDWVINFADTTNKVVQITDIFPDTNEFAFKVMATARQVP